MSNPLDNLPFDINSMIPQTEFNWDCVDGIDQVHKDILQMWEKAVIAATAPLAKVVASTQGIGTNISNFAAAQLPKVQDTINQIDGSIANNLSTRVAPYTAQLGTAGSGSYYWIVARKHVDGNYYYRVEQWSVAPPDVVAYGPYDNQCILYVVLCAQVGASTPHQTPPQPDTALAQDIASKYQQYLSSGQYDLVNCTPTTYCATAPVPVEDIPTGIPPKLPPTTQPPPYILKGRFGGDCNKFLSMTWVHSDTLDAELRNQGYKYPDVPALYNEEGLWLSQDGWNAFNTLCHDITIQPPPVPPPVIKPPEPQPIPPPVPPIINPPPPPPPKECPPCPQPIPQPIIQREPPPPISMDDCCIKIAAALEDIVTALSNPIPINLKVDETLNGSSGMSDEEYVVSGKSETDTTKWLAHLQSEYNPDSKIVSLVTAHIAVKDFLNELSKSPFDDDNQGDGQ